MDDEHDIDDIADVCKYLEAAGLRVTRIDVDPKVLNKRCDLSAEDVHAKYLVEVKAINDEDEIKQTLRKGEYYETVRSHVYRKRVAKEVHNAKNQLQSTAIDYPDHIWLVALIAGSKCDARFMSEQIIGTLYGVAAITDCGPAGENRRRRCLYFSESAFYKHPGLDGAIVLDPEGVSLYMNDYGRQRDRVRKSGLACFLAQHNAFYDMAKLESDFDCLVADFEGDRADEKAVFERLKQKYPGRKLQYMNWYRSEGILALTVREIFDEEIAKKLV
ncbi:MAG: hypothetical protein KAV82_12420 [Phycisphaerae bacterium]|nr:hypothetical protein [Phycisphaerae bacterium]